MKIVLVGNGNQKHRGARYYDQCSKLANGFTRNGHHVFFISDRDIARAATPIGVKSIGKRFCNRYFLDVCRQFKPDLIVLYHADMITLDTMLEARRMLPSVRVAQFNVDTIFNPRTIAQITDKLDAIDATFCTTAGEALRRFSRDGKRVAFVPNIVDASMEWPRGFEHSDQPHDVFWALRALDNSVAGDRRIEYPLYLEQNGIRMDYHGMNGKPLLFDARYFEAIARAKMGLNISQIWTRGHHENPDPREVYLYSSDRISHYLGSGLLVLITRDHRLEELLEENVHAVYFDGKEELLDKVRYYAAHDAERKRIAHTGWEKAHRAFNERLVARFIEEVTFEHPFSHAYEWPTERW